MPNRRSFIFLGLAVLFGVGAALAARSYIAEQSAMPEPSAPELAVVVTAARDVPAGRALVPDDLTAAEWPRELRPEGAAGDPEQLIGRVVSRRVVRGEPLLAGALLPAGSAAGLPALISEEHRAVSVKVDAVVGVAGFVQPGAKVDVLATFRNTEEGNFSNVILQDIKVLAVDQTIDRARDGEPKIVNVATLEVDTKEAERLIHAAHEGRLQLALRGPGDSEVVNTPPVVARDMLGRTKPAPRKAGPGRATIQVIKGTRVSDEAY